MTEMRDWVILRGPETITEDASFRMSAETAAEASIISERVPDKAIADLIKDPRTLEAAPEMPIALIEPVAVTGGSGGSGGAGGTWGIGAVGADASSHDGRGVKVAVLDTGIDKDHPAFAGIQLDEKDFSGSGNGDRNGHGTHCAGTIFGRDVGGQRIGVARGVDQALIGKVLNDSGRGNTLGMFFGMQWAAERGAHIISMSLGFDTPGLIARLVADGWPDQMAAAVGIDTYRRNIRLFDKQIELLEAMEDHGKGPLVVAASGNESGRDVDPRYRIPASLPACAKGVVSVGALMQASEGLRIANFSNSLPRVSAPGVDILSAWPGGGLKSLNGTSMACPHVAGVAALWWQATGSMASQSFIRSKVEASGNVGALVPGYDHSDVGAGLVQSP